MTKKELKELSILCTKNIRFTFGGKTFVQSDVVVRGSPLGPVLADISENTLVPTLTEYMKFWKRHLDETICSVKIGSAEYIVSILKSFAPDIQLDVLLARNGNNIVTIVYRKTTNDLYLTWNSFAPTSWKRGTLKTLIDCVYLICSSPEL